MNNPLFSRRLGLAFLAAAAIAAAVVQAQTTKPGGGGVARLKPDLSIQALRAERTGITAAGAHQVRITVQVRCTGRFAGGAGPFRIRLEKSDGAAGGLSLVGQADLPGLSTGFESAAASTATRTFDDTVAAGLTRRYLATVDSGAAVDESNEGNNQSVTTYSADGCPGSDLSLTRVEAIRGRGSVLFHVWVMNRCLSPCDGDIFYRVTPIAPAGPGSEQGIAARIDGEATLGPMGTMAVECRMDVDVRFEITVGIRGGACVDASTANNTCRLVLLATEDRKTVVCR